MVPSQLIGDTIYAVWGDTRNRILNIWFAKKSIFNDGYTGIVNLDMQKTQIEIWPNPADEYFAIKCADFRWAKLFDNSGALVHCDQQRKIQTASLLPGSYTLVINTSYNLYSKKILVQH